MPTATVTIEILSGQSGFASLIDQWNALAGRCATHFLHFPGWYGAELRNLQAEKPIYFVALYDSSELFAVLPFERDYLRKGAFKVPILQLFYPNEMGVNDVLSDRPLLPYRQLLQAELRRRLPFFAFIRWQCVLQNGCARTLLTGAEQPRFTHASKFIDFSQGFTPFWEAYSSKFRKGLQKKMRKAEEQGALRLWCATSQTDLPLAFEHFLIVEDSGWKGEGGTSIKKQPKKLAYYQHLLDYYGSRNLCQINILYLNDVPIAAHFSVRVGQRLFLLKIGFCEDFAAVSPGYLILYKLVEQSAQQDIITSVSFVTGVNWIDRWHPQHIPVGIFYLGNGHWYSALGVQVLVAAVAYKNRRAQAEKPTESIEADD